jgi:DNA-binding transcriptional regulator YdaS (Cro superfamily)
MRVKREFIVVAVLGLVLVLVWMWVLGIVPGNKTVREPIEKPVTGQVSPQELRKKAEEAALSLSDWLRKQEEIDKMLVYHEGARDPFFFLPKEREKIEKSLPLQPPKLVLKGIVWDETKPLALINGLVVKEGDTIQGATIVKIDFERVTIRYRSKEFIIELIKWKGEKSSEM